MHILISLWYVHLSVIWWVAQPFSKASRLSLGKATDLYCEKLLKNLRPTLDGFLVYKAVYLTSNRAMRLP